MKIKKYKNRKLYNLNTKKYTTQEEILNIYLDTGNVEVICVVTNKDITKEILLRAISSSKNYQLINSCFTQI